MMVEVMCGMLGGGPYAHHIRKWGDEHREADLVYMSTIIHTAHAFCVYMIVYYY